MDSTMSQTEALTSEKYVLSLSPDYVSHWGFWEAIRELLQNSIDQKQADDKCEIVFNYNKDDETLTIGSTNCKLDRRSLLLGSTTKANDRNSIGCFGEGYKLALLVLARNLLDVKIHNGDEIWRPSFEHNDQYDAHVLTITIEPAPYDLKGVAFYIKGVPESLEDGNPLIADDDAVRCCYEDIHQNYLIDAVDDTIFHEDHMRGRIFIRGLFVCKVDGLEYGYNFAPYRLSLDRDRGMADTFEVQIQTSNLWQKTTDTSLLYDNMKKGVPDLNYVTLTDTRIKQKIIDRYMAEHPGAIPIASQKEADFLAGHKTSIVPKRLRDLIWGVVEYKVKHRGTPTERLERFFARFKYTSLYDDEATREWDSIIETSKHWTGPSDIES